MRKAYLLALPLFAVAIAVCARDSKGFQPETIIAAERAALDRWINDDPQGYLEAYAPEVTYFDPSREKRVDGLGAMKELLIRITGKVKIDRYELIDQRFSATAILRYCHLTWSAM